MKRMTALLLCAVLLLGILPGLAAEYTLDEKLYKQVKDGSGLKLAIKAEKTGGQFSLLDEVTNAALSALLPGLEVSLRYLNGVGTLKGQQETELVLTRSGEQLGNFRLLKDPMYEQFTSTFLGVNRYVDKKDGQAIMALLTGKDQVWPPLEGVLYRLNTAESTWQGQVAARLDAYLMKLTVWLQGFTRTEAIRSALNQPQTRVTLSVPAAAVKAQIKQLLLDMYADTALLALLAQEMDARQAAAYLQPGMLNSFFQSLDLMPMNENLVSERLLDAQGQILENKMVLPMGGARGLTRIRYSFTASPTGGQNSLVFEMTPKTAANREGRRVSLVYEGGQTAGSEEISYSGTLAIQEEAAVDDFTVDQAEGEVPAKVYAFNLLFVPGPEVVDSALQTSARDFELTFRLSPQGQDQVASQQVRASLSLQSRLNSRSATYLTGVVTWLDEGSRAQIKLDLSGNTAPPWNMDMVDVTGATRLDLMTGAQVKALGEQARTTLLSAFTSLLMRLTIPTVNP